MTSAELPYIGNELDLFSHARNWKAYFASHLKPFISGDVAEVGAGLGGTTATLCTGTESSWTCLEPDPVLCAEIVSKCRSGALQANVVAHVATLASFDPAARFDTVLYIDVLEHIEHDREEANRAAMRLKPGGNLVVLAPAHQSLFTSFDEAIGHFRRYDKSSLTSLEPEGLQLRTCFYLDSVGLFASVANKLLLRQSSPTIAQIKIWDNLMIPVSRLSDQLTGRMFGKTVIAVWQRPAA